SNSSRASFFDILSGQPHRDQFTRSFEVLHGTQKTKKPKMKTKLTLSWLTFAFLIAACSRPGATAGTPALKPIDQAALQTMVDKTAKELLIPGAVILLRTPQGEFAVTYGTTLLGATTPP